MSDRIENDRTQNDPIPQDDPRLTAYALGAMEAGEAAALEQQLEGDAAAQAEVEAIRALAGDLESEFAATPAEDADEGLDDARRATVLAEGGEAVVKASTPARRTRVGLWSAVGLAASLLVGVPLLIASMTPMVQERGRSAGRSTAEETARLDGSLEVDVMQGGAESRPALQRRPTEGRSNWNEIFREPQAGSGGGAGGSIQTDNDLPYAESLGGSGGQADAPFEGPASNGTIGVGGGEGGAFAGRAANRRFKAKKQGAGGPFVGHVQGGPVAGHPVQGVQYELPPGSVVKLDEVTNGLESSSPGIQLRLRDMYRGYGAGGTWANWSIRHHGEQYTHPGIDGFMTVTKRGGHTSTFSIDVDSASYTNVRRMLNAGQRPHPAAVRLEEFVNFFDYGYAPPAADAEEPFAQHIQVAACPWNPTHRLVRIALKGKEIEREERPASNLVFLVDVSGSMKSEDKLPLLQSALEMLVENLDARDRISIVTYASSAGLALESTNGDQRDVILGKIRSLKAGGSTNGAGGIQLAYAEAQKHFLKDGTNRVILCTDGDFNVGVSDGPGLTRLVQEKAKGGVYLSVLGFGTGNLQDGKMEAYSNAGNGNYAYIDGLDEAKRVLVEQMEGTLITIAKDVKFQVWFNPKTVKAWRLLGYENRRLAARDFNDDSKDAGDIGAGHEVTALYELVPTGVSIPGAVDANPFVEGTTAPKTAPKDDSQADDPTPSAKALFIWRLRYKQPDGDVSRLVERNVFDKGLTFEQADRDFQWAAGVTAFGMLLRHSPHRGQASWALVEELAAPAKGEDPNGRRAEFLGLVAKAKGR